MGEENERNSRPERPEHQDQVLSPRRVVTPIGTEHPTVGHASLSLHQVRGPADVLRGPFRRRWGQSARAGAGEYLVRAGSDRPIVLGAASGIPLSEKFLKPAWVYWLVSRRSALQVASVDARAKRPLDCFHLTVSYVIEVPDATAAAEVVLHHRAGSSLQAEVAAHVSRYLRWAAGSRFIEEAQYLARSLEEREVLPRHEVPHTVRGPEGYLDESIVELESIGTQPTVPSHLRHLEIRIIAVEVKPRRAAWTP